MGFQLLRRCLLWFFRTFYLLEVRGLEHVPATGPVIIAANHVNPFDAVIIGVSIPRRIRFVVWNRSFDNPILGPLLRLSGCIPINRDKPDTTAFRESLRWLQAGHILGIFPEGRYTETGRLSELKPGAVRIALVARATVVPATLTGAYRAWPLRGANAKAFPKPWKISLKFHPPILNEPSTINHEPSSISSQRSAAADLTRKLETAINSTLEPAIRAEEKLDRLAQQPAPHIRLYEWFFCVVMLLCWWLARWDWFAVAIAAGYSAYLLADLYLIRPSWWTRALRNFSPLLALAAGAPSLTRVAMADIATHAPLEWAAVGLVAAYILWSMLEYHFNKYLQFQRFLRGFLVAFYFTVLTLMSWPALRATALPALTLSLCAYTLAYDFAHNRHRFLAAALPVLAACAYIAFVPRYPPAFILVNLAIVAAVFAYINLLKFRAHDGRRI
jgi:1-acyl-sn-glycerol-3-phosphate acyltransferase